MPKLLKPLPICEDFTILGVDDWLVFGRRPDGSLAFFSTEIAPQWIDCPYDDQGNDGGAGVLWVGCAMLVGDRANIRPGFGLPEFEAIDPEVLPDIERWLL